jgi:hypothetical protein
MQEVTGRKSAHPGAAYLKVYRASSPKLRGTAGADQDPAASLPDALATIAANYVAGLPFARGRSTAIAYRIEGSQALLGGGVYATELRREMPSRGLGIEDL